MESGPIAPDQLTGKVKEDKRTLPSRNDLMKDLKKSFEEAGNKLDQKERKKAWQKTAEVVERFSDATIKQWNREISALLTFASLFAGFITTFLSQTYPMLRSQNDNQNAVLIHLSSQIASFAVNSSFMNTTSPPFDASLVLRHSGAPPWVVWLNSLLFIALVLALAAASTGLLSQQWLNAYTADLFGKERVIARRRQYRWHQLRRWKVHVIIAVIPFLLQVSLVVFLAALSILLFNLDDIIAAIVVPVVCLLLAFIALTTLLPAFCQDCCYYSLQSRAFFWVVEQLKKPFAWGADFLGGLGRKVDAWSHFLESSSFTEAVVKMGSVLKPRNWRGQELQLYSSSTEPAHDFDNKMITMAFTITMDADLVSTAKTCLIDRADVEFYKSYIVNVSDTLTDPRIMAGPKQWLEPVFREYRHVLYTALQFSLAHNSDQGQPKDPGPNPKPGKVNFIDYVSENLDNLLPGDDNVTLPYAPKPPYDRLLFKDDDHDRAQVFRILALLCLAPNPSEHLLSETPARMAWDCLVRKVLDDEICKARPMVPEEVLSVSSVAKHVFVLSRDLIDRADTNSHDKQTSGVHTTTGRNSGRPANSLTGWLSPDQAAETPRTCNVQPLWHYIDALRMCLYCLSQSPSDTVIHSTGVEVLGSFSRFLTSPTWLVLCRSLMKRPSRPDLSHLDFAIKSIATLRDSAIPRTLVTTELLNALTDGVRILAESATMLQAADSEYIRRCNDLLATLKGGPPARHTSVLPWLVN